MFMVEFQQHFQDYVDPNYVKYLKRNINFV